MIVKYVNNAGGGTGTFASPWTLSVAIDWLNATWDETDEAEIRILGDVTLGATPSAITKSGSRGTKVLWAGRSVDDSGYQQMEVDGADTATTVFRWNTTLSTLAYHTWIYINIKDCATSGPFGGWEFSQVGVSRVAWYSCSVDNCYRGWSFNASDDSTQGWLWVGPCTAKNNADVGWSLP